MLVDDKTPKGCTGAVRSLCARTTTLAGSDVGIGTVAMTPAAVVQGLALGAILVLSPRYGPVLFFATAYYQVLGSPR